MVISKLEHARTTGEAGADASVGVPPTSAVFHIMLALAGGDAHGYGIMRSVEQLSGGEMKLGPGTLYRSIQRMVVDGLIEEHDIALDDEADDDRRRYYRLTARGFAAARAESNRLAVLVDAARARRLLSPVRKPGGKR